MTKRTQKYVVAYVYGDTVKLVDSETREPLHTYYYATRDEIVKFAADKGYCVEKFMKMW